MFLLPILPGLEAHPSAALWLGESRSLLIADVHLGYSWAQRRRGELGPLADFRAREKLLTTVEELQPCRIVFLGDLVHAPRPCEQERVWLEETLRALLNRAEIIAVRGNHDRAFGRDFGHLPIERCDFWTAPGLTAVHGDRLNLAPLGDTQTLIAGHLHPCLGVRDASGASHNFPVFLANRHCVVLPAFSPFARGFDISCGLPKELANCFRDAPMEAYAATTKRVVRLGRLRDTVERMWQEPAGTPAQFRRRAASK